MMRVKSKSKAFWIQPELKNGPYDSKPLVMCRVLRLLRLIQLERRVIDGPHLSIWLLLNK